MSKYDEEKESIDFGEAYSGFQEDDSEAGDEVTTFEEVETGEENIHEEPKEDVNEKPKKEKKQGKSFNKSKLAIILGSVLAVSGGMFVWQSGLLDGGSDLPVQQPQQTYQPKKQQPTQENTEIAQNTVSQQQETPDFLSFDNVEPKEQQEQQASSNDYLNDLDRELGYVEDKQPQFTGPVVQEDVKVVKVNEKPSNEMVRPVSTLDQKQQELQHIENNYQSLKKLEEMRETIKTLEEKVASQETKIKSLEDRIAEQQRLLESKTNELNQIISENAKMIIALKGKIDELEKIISNKDIEINSLKSEVSEREVVKLESKDDGRVKANIIKAPSLLDNPVETQTKQVEKKAETKSNNYIAFIDKTQKPKVDKAQQAKKAEVKKVEKYSIRSILNGVAWVVLPNGSTKIFSEGDELNNVKIGKIDPNLGIFDLSGNKILSI